MMKRKSLGVWFRRSAKSMGGVNMSSSPAGDPESWKRPIVGPPRWGAKSMGLNIALPHEQEPNPYITPTLSFQFRYFALRKMQFPTPGQSLGRLSGRLWNLG